MTQQAKPTAEMQKPDAHLAANRESAVQGLDAAGGVQEPVNPWKEALLDQLAVACMDAPQDEPPSSILKRVIQWNVQVALDPAVSREAQALIDKGIAREPLTEQQMAELWLRLPGDKGSSQFAWAFARAIERAHGIGASPSDDQTNSAAISRAGEA